MADPEDLQGPLMMAATSFLRRGPARIGRIGSNIVLPRTVQVSHMVAAGAGAGVGVIAGAFLSALTGQSMLLLWCAGIGGGLGVVAATWSPIQGENLAVFLGLSARSMRGRVRIDGEPVRAYIGLARLDRTPAGDARIEAAAVDVAAGGAVDGRGVPLRVIRGRRRRR